MKFYIPFGDWSDDGHGKRDKILVEAPSMESLLEAENKIKKQYGSEFFEGFANEFDDSSLSESVRKALEENCNIKVTEGEQFDLTDIQEYFISLLNAFGAGIMKLESYPEINNWTCEGFETVGYGCFYV